jgi:hypothetical protein
MTPAAPSEQKNPYKGFPERPWIRLRLAAPDGSTVERAFLADTGNPCAVILGQQDMNRLKAGDGPDLQTNFGLLQGGWLQIAMPELGLTGAVLGYASDAVAAAAAASHPDFKGLIGLPLLRQAEFGGNADWFWVRTLGDGQGVSDPAGDAG